MNFALEGNLKIYAKTKEGALVPLVNKANTITYNARNMLAYMFAQQYDNSGNTILQAPSYMTLISDTANLPPAGTERQDDGDEGTSFTNSLRFKIDGSEGIDPAVIKFVDPIQNIGSPTEFSINNSVDVTPSIISGGSVSSAFAGVQITSEIEPNGLYFTEDPTNPGHPLVSNKSNYIQRVVIWNTDPTVSPINSPWDEHRVLSVATLASPILIQPDLYYVIIYTYKIR